MTQIDGKNYHNALTYIANLIYNAHAIYNYNITPIKNTSDPDKVLYIAKCMDRIQELIHISLSCYITMCHLIGATYHSNIYDFLKDKIFNSQSIKINDIAKEIDSYLR